MSISRRSLILALFCAPVLAAPLVVAAHGGRTDGSGCHGGTRKRHCHTPKRSIAPKRKRPPTKKTSRTIKG